ncbi:hypothetical protein BLNAU_21451 [Blattamonas nauphoetae]|uniref:Uncharacterized protein n=1 Tax=Blattamonas nauphoetae TaxID=2049346 RepID=A0ABQ9WVV4_9EUKA|nr:hypothetical protein BLNAU_21451 [Blattamonas nauphoetae]
MDLSTGDDDESNDAESASLIATPTSPTQNDTTPIIDERNQQLLEYRAVQMALCSAIKLIGTLVTPPLLPLLNKTGILNRLPIFATESQSIVLKKAATAVVHSILVQLPPQTHPERGCGDLQFCFEQPSQLTPVITTNQSLSPLPLLSEQEASVSLFITTLGLNSTTLEFLHNCDVKDNYVYSNPNLAFLTSF